MKTVTLKDKAYYKFASLKSGKESFSDVIERLYENVNPSLESYFGILKNVKYEKSLKDWEKIKKKEDLLFLKKTRELDSR